MDSKGLDRGSSDSRVTGAPHQYVSHLYKTSIIAQYVHNFVLVNKFLEIFFKVPIFILGFIFPFCKIY